MACGTSRCRALLGLPRYILPRDETPRAKEIAHFCRLAMAEVPNLHINLRHQFEALTHGWSVRGNPLAAARPRDPSSGKWGLDLIDRPMWRFLYRQKELHVRRPDGQHLKAPAGRFLVNRTFSKDSPWGGNGLFHRLYWYWFAGEHGWKYFAVLLEKWAQPTAVGKYKRAVDSKVDQQNVQRLMQAINHIQTEYSIVIPDDLVVDLLEAQARRRRHLRDLHRSGQPCEGARDPGVRAIPPASSRDKDPSLGEGFRTKSASRRSASMHASWTRT